MVFTKNVGLLVKHTQYYAMYVAENDICHFEHIVN